MAHIDPLDPHAVPELAELFAAIRASSGQIPNLYLTLARRPPILRALADLGASIMTSGSVAKELKILVAFVASNTAGCRFCSAHTAHQAYSASVPLEKLRRVFDFADDPIFSPAERVALRMARDSALQPSEVAADHFVELRQHFRDEQILELVSVSCLFAFMNRWHDVVGTDLEAGYEDFITEHLLHATVPLPPARP